jgi:hypothetical protein
VTDKNGAKDPFDPENLKLPAEFYTTLTMSSASVKRTSPIRRQDNQRPGEVRPGTSQS